MKGKHTMEEYEVISIPVSDGTEPVSYTHLTLPTKRIEET